MIKPYKTPHHISQGFSLNFNSYYKSAGLLGHSGIDFVGDHLTPIYSVVDSYCYSHVNRENFNLKKFRAVYTLSEINGVWYEISYGHLMDIIAVPKTYIKAGTQIGTQGNTGKVFFGGVEPTDEQRLQGLASHLHFQMRPVKQVSIKTSGKKYLSDANGTLKYLDKFWEIIDYENGYNGAINPLPFFDLPDQTKKYKELQELLNKHGANLVVDGKFGKLSRQALEIFLQ